MEDGGRRIIKDILYYIVSLGAASDSRNSINKTDRQKDQMKSSKICLAAASNSHINQNILATKPRKTKKGNTNHLWRMRESLIEEAVTWVECLSQFGSRIYPKFHVLKAWSPACCCWKMVEPLTGRG